MEESRVGREHRLRRLTAAAFPDTLLQAMTHAEHQTGAAADHRPELPGERLAGVSRETLHAEIEHLQAGTLVILSEALEALYLLATEVEERLLANHKSKTEPREPQKTLWRDDDPLPSPEEDSDST